MTIQLSITAADTELSFGAGLLRIFPSGATLPPDVTPLAYDLLVCSPVEMDDDGVTPRKLGCGLLCTVCAHTCPSGPPPPKLGPVTNLVPGNLGAAATLAVNRGGVTYGQTEVHFAPGGSDLLSPGPVLVIPGMQTALADIADTVAAWLGITDPLAQVQVQVFNVYDPSQATDPPSPTPHPLHDTAIAIPVIPWVAPPSP